jgi:ABC-2 type transport system ATP-binding protein
MTTVIKTTNLTKKYKNVYALKDVSINIEKGEIYGIVGKNGAGKSTLLKLLSGITEPTKGSVELFQETNLMEQRKRMASIVENPTLFGELSAKDNLEYFRIQRGVTDKNTINETLRQVGLDPDDKKQVKKYSVGMKQRLALALSLLTNPEVLILDEPTNGIDPVGIVEIRHLLQALNEEKNVTIIISSHILSSLANIATKIAILDEGKIVEELTLDELYEKSSEYIEIITTSPEKATIILELELDIHDYEIKPDTSIVIYEKLDQLEEIVKALVQGGIGITKVLKEHKTLEEYYLEITQKGGSE